jgi:hypothetical protein
MAASSSSTSTTTTLGPAVGEKLTRDNWIQWKAQFLPALRGAQLMHFLDDMTIVPPAEIIIEMDDKKKKPNPEYATWITQDQMILSYLMNSLTKEILMHVATKVTTEQHGRLWKNCSRPNLEPK